MSAKPRSNKRRNGNPSAFITRRFNESWPEWSGFQTKKNTTITFFHSLILCQDLWVYFKCVRWRTPMRSLPVHLAICWLRSHSSMNPWGLFVPSRRPVIIYLYYIRRYSYMYEICRCTWARAIRRCPICWPLGLTLVQLFWKLWGSIH